MVYKDIVLVFFLISQYSYAWSVVHFEDCSHSVTNGTAIDIHVCCVNCHVDLHFCQYSNRACSLLSMVLSCSCLISVLCVW